MSLKKQLDRYKKHLSHAKDTSILPNDQIIEMPASSKNEGAILSKSLQEAAIGLEAEIKIFEDQAMLETKTRYPLSSQHGLYKLNEIHEACGLWEDELMDHPLSSQHLQAEDLLFFDTETTGLGAGAGHMIFLLGTGRVLGDEFQVTQYFLPGPGHETAFYYHFLTDCQSLSNLVTFNGKAFDWPRVKTRVQFVRDRVPKLPEFGHFDLLHASRRLWKPDLESVRLSSVEESILDVHRELDIPGHMAPFLYFQFLKQPKASLVKGVFEHNREDVRSLVTLYIHLTRILHQKGVELTYSEQYESCRWLAGLNYSLEASIRLEKLIKQDMGTHEEKIRALQLLALTYKKLKNEESAHQLFYQLVHDLKATDFRIYIELAKYYEHHEKDFEQAIFYALCAQDHLDNTLTLKKTALDEADERLRHRLNRLYTKLEAKK